MKHSILAILASITLSACGTAKLADPAKDIEAKNFKSKPDAAVFYVYRNELMGAAVGMDVSVDGKKIGTTAANSYVYTEVPAGKHTVTGKAENESSLDINAELGHIYYVWQEVKMGFMYARNKLHQVGDDEGKKGVMESRLIEGEK